MQLRFAQKLWDQTIEYFSTDKPEFAKNLEENCEHITGGSPFTLDHYINSSNGQMYGLDHAVKRFGIEASILLRPECIGVEGLYFSGQDVSSAGFVGAQMGGILTASVILKRNLLIDFMEYRSELKKQAKKKNE